MTINNNSIGKCQCGCYCGEMDFSFAIRISTIPPADNTGYLCTDCEDLEWNEGGPLTYALLHWVADEVKDGKESCKFAGGSGQDNPFICFLDGFGQSHGGAPWMEVWFFQDGDFLIEFSWVGEAWFASILASDHSYAPTDHDCFEELSLTLTSDVDITEGVGGSAVCTWPSSSVFTFNLGET